MAKIEKYDNDAQGTAVEYIIRNTFSSPTMEMKRLAGGYGGYAYDVTVTANGEPRHVVVKLTEPQDEEPFETEDTNKRVYGMRLSNFKPAYDLLLQRGMSIPELYASGSPSQDVPFTYQVMSLLEGVSLREFLAHGTEDSNEELHAVTGEEFGKLHTITRPYQGWVALNAAQARDWKGSFFSSLASRLQEATSLNQNIQQMGADITAFVRKKEESWTDATEFVLSHVDGFQGMAKKENTWQFTGLIDIEDHTFTDQRFVLAGYELSQKFEGRTTPESFWKAYEKQKVVDPTYDQHKQLFQLYYLLSWLPLVYENDWRGDPKDREDVVKRFETLISEVEI